LVSQCNVVLWQPQRLNTHIIFETSSESGNEATSTTSHSATQNEDDQHGTLSVHYKQMIDLKVKFVWH